MRRIGAPFVATVLLAGCATAAPPVAWRSWTPEAFDEARRENRLIVVHVEAVWCHWCHVMLDETYGDERVRAAVAADYVPIRVDSDARPDVAERYRDWGWPATAILSPDARDVLTLRGYQEAPGFAATLRETAAAVREGRKVPAPPPRAPTPLRDADLAQLRAAVERRLDSFYDDELGGWGRQQKYPLAAPVEHAFLRAALRGASDADEARWRDRALFTLGQEARLVDPVWGGMYQYSIPESWDRPHFEKIVPVQAGAIDSFARAYRVTGDARWRELADRVRSYVAEFLTAPDGGWYASQDADVGSHPEDGVPFVDGHEFYARDDAARRAGAMPRVDRNVYADRCGMGAAALCELYAATGDAAALRDAERAVDAIVGSYGEPSTGFRHAAAGADPLLHLDDQVEMGLALVRLWECTGDRRRLGAALALARDVLPRLAAPDGGWYAHTEDPSAVGVFAERRRPFAENARAARFLLRLAWITDDEAWRRAAEAAMRATAAEDLWIAEGRAIGDSLLALEEATTPVLHVTVVGEPGDAATDALHRAALALPVPVCVVTRARPGDSTYPPGASVCTSRTCSDPVTDPATLAGVVESVLAQGR